MLSPAIVPATSARPARSMPSASAAAAPGEVRIDHARVGAHERERELVQQVPQQGRSGRRARRSRRAPRSATPSCVVHPREPELLDVAADRRLRRLDAQSRQARADLLLARRAARAPTRPRIACWRFALRPPRCVRAHAAATSRASDAANAFAADVDLLGVDHDQRRREPHDVGAGRRWPARRRRASRARRRRRDALGRAGPRTGGRAPRTSATIPAGASRDDLVAERAPIAAHVREQAVLPRSCPAPRAQPHTATGPPPKVDACSPGPNASVARATQGTDRQAAAERLRERDDVGHDARGRDREPVAAPTRCPTAPRRRPGARRRRSQSVLARAQVPRRRADGPRPRRAPARASTARDVAGRQRAASSAAASPGGTNRNQSTSGSNGARFAGCPVAASVGDRPAMERALQRHDRRPARARARACARA